MQKTIVVRVITIFAVLLASALLEAQTGNGSIQGTVTDATKAVVPNAKVSLTRQATNESFSTQSNGIGFFVFPSLTFGNYKVRVEAAGFQAWEAELMLLAGQTAEINPTLPVGAVTQTMMVSGEVTQLATTTSGTLGNVLERERVEELPLNGRNFTGLLVTVPGWEGNNSGNASFIYGLRYGEEIQMDGALMQDRYVGNTFARPPGLDSIGEMEATTNSASAKLARPGLLTLSTRSGSNQIHGSLYETARNNAVGLARARTDYYTKPPHLVRNEFGGSVGGPIRIPKIYNGRDRTFFFFNYEARRQMQNSTTSISVPTAAMDQGIFTGLTSANGQAITLYDPYSSGPAPTYTRTPYPNNVIPQSKESPLTKFVFGDTPQPTFPTVNPLSVSNYFGPTASDTREYTYTMRFDQHISERDQIFVRYTRGRQGTYSTGVNSSPATLDGLANVSLGTEQTNTAVVSYLHTFSPTFFSETLANFMYDYIGNPAVGGGNIDNQFGVPDPVGQPGTGYPRIYPAGTTAGPYMDYNSGTAGAVNIGRVFNLDQNFTKVIGRHELLFGGRFRQESLDYQSTAQLAAGALYFSGSATGLVDPNSGAAYNPLPNTANPWADMFLGIANYYATQFWRNDYKNRAGERTLYFQDNIKVNPRLTVNAGLRWEYFLPFQTVDGGIVGWDPKTLAIVLGTTPSNLIQLGDASPALVNGLQSEGMTFETPQQAGLPSTLVYNYWKNFGPRAGFAYRATGGAHPFVLRGGASLYAFPEPERTFTTNAQYTMPTVGTFTYQPNSSANSPDGLSNFLVRNAPQTVVGVNAANTIDVNNALAFLTPGSQIFRVQDPNQPTNRAWTWNFTIEKELGRSTLVSAGYIGTHGYNLGQWAQQNSGYDQNSAYVWYTATGQPLPTGTYSGVIGRPYYSPTGPGSVYGAIEVSKKIGWSNMNGIQLQAQHRFSNGIGFQAFYVLTNALRAGGNGWSDDEIQNAAYYLPGTVPTDLHARDRLLYYARDTEVPKHRFNYNWIYNLPFGRGRQIGSHMNRVLDGFAGGWQVVGSGSITSTYFTLPTSNYGAFSKVQVYGKQYPIEDCRSGTCYRGYFWWNGYIPPTQISSASLSACPKGMVCGLPSSYTPAEEPVDVTPGTTYYNTNTVPVTLATGQVVTTSYNTNLNPYINQYAPGPRTIGLNASLWKAFQVYERASLQFHADFFNVLNMPGLVGPSSDGSLSLQSSSNSPRNLQLSLRLIW